MRIVRLFTCSAILLLTAGFALADNNSTDPPRYDVNPVGETGAPVIDGVVGDGEWDAAAPAAGDWVDLRTHLPDTHNLRFRMLWDDTNLYILGQTDYDGFPEGPPAGDLLGNPNFGGGSYNPNFYIDPNTDDEEYFSEDWVVDGYQFAWDVFEGFAARRPTPSDPELSLRDPQDENGDFVNDYSYGLFLEAHANSAFGNQGLYDLGNDGPNGNYRDDKHPGIVFAQNASNDDLNGTGQPGGVWEFAIAWEEFNATNPNRQLTQADVDANPAEIEDTREFILDENGDEIENPTFGELIPNPGYLGEVGDLDPRFADPEHPRFIDNGLYAVDGPEPGDVWAFETSIITPDTANNFLPSWSEPQGGDPTRSSFAPWGESGHGRITFIGPDLPSIFDCNGDGVVDLQDANCATPETIVGTLEEAGLVQGDFDGEGGVAFPDFLTLSANFGQPGNYTDGNADASADGIAFPDFLILSANFGKGAAAAAAVPEPGSLSLLLIGFLAFLHRRRS